MTADLVVLKEAVTQSLLSAYHCPRYTPSGRTVGNLY